MCAPACRVMNHTINHHAIKREKWSEEGPGYGGVAMESCVCTGARKHGAHCGRCHERDKGAKVSRGLSVTFLEPRSLTSGVVSLLYFGRIRDFGVEYSYALVGTCTMTRGLVDARAGEWMWNVRLRGGEQMGQCRVPVRLSTKSATSESEGEGEGEGRVVFGGA
ncbi:hypothetical protein CC85DRAFT_125453 [Cutaneotrichosporon oleaginosum]|uniref:Uncharacterized protein n=1 Tax=Cutaneotrichosporon oleaginosum TaxID=879819 RepID=A0A0J0XJR2_9TREE|nr:uncharacterized protein CC85DRAFT_125453 [Cutaneotrichosporon oleaginosum]KLT41328.1 hypothetical protein CC85DRAFT_125453 [Cutaneotrichosporon oleaginosum]TXT14078.1 hypothetical protein COLE_00271 [Cutaneotrichosporon oleaginosum]